MQQRSSPSTGAQPSLLLMFPLAAHVPRHLASNHHLQQKAARGEPRGHNLTCHVASCGNLDRFWGLALGLWLEWQAGSREAGEVPVRGPREPSVRGGLLQEGEW